MLPHFSHGAWQKSTPAITSNPHPGQCRQSRCQCIDSTDGRPRTSASRIGAAKHMAQIRVLPEVVAGIGKHGVSSRSLELLFRVCSKLLRERAGCLSVCRKTAASRRSADECAHSCRRVPRKGTALQTVLAFFLAQAASRPWQYFCNSTNHVPQACSRIPRSSVTSVVSVARIDEIAAALDV